MMDWRDGHAGVTRRELRPHYSRGFVTKLPRRHARWASGSRGTGPAVCGGAAPLFVWTVADQKGASPQQYVEGQSGEPVG